MTDKSNKTHSISLKSPKNPVTINCGHTIDKSILETLCKLDKKVCPVCCEPFIYVNSIDLNVAKASKKRRISADEAKNIAEKHLKSNIDDMIDEHIIPKIIEASKRSEYEIRIEADLQDKLGKCIEEELKKIGYKAWFMCSAKRFEISWNQEKS